MAMGLGSTNSHSSQVKHAPGMVIITQIDTQGCSKHTLAINSRVHASALGIDEDPVTGSAHAYMTAFYLLSPVFDTLPSSTLGGEGKDKKAKPTDITIDASQLSARGGKLKCTLDQSDTSRVGIVGTATEMARGTLSIW